jgi:Tfp pilus assembly protein PilF
MTVDSATPQPTHADARSLTDLAVLLLRDEENQHALDVVEKAIVCDPHYARAYAIRAECANALGLSSDAVKKDLELALSLSPECGEVYSFRGDLALFAGRHEDAVKECERALACDSNLTSAYEIIAQTHFQTKQYDLAYEYAQKALALDGYSSRALWVLAHGVAFVGRPEETAGYMLQLRAARAIKRSTQVTQASRHTNAGRLENSLPEAGAGDDNNAVAHGSATEVPRNTTEQLPSILLDAFLAPQQPIQAERLSAVRDNDGAVAQSSEYLKVRCTNCKVSVTGTPVSAERGPTIECPVCANRIPAWPRPEDAGLIGQRMQRIMTPQPLEPNELSTLLGKLATYCWEMPHVADIRFPSQAVVRSHSLVPIYRVTQLTYDEVRTAKHCKRQLQDCEQPLLIKTGITQPDPWKVTLAEFPYGIDCTNSPSFTELVPVPDTEEHRKCHSCNAAGVVSCPSCEGYGKKPCSRCDGRRHHNCGTCGGSGQERVPNRVQELVTCSVCGGRGMKGAFAERMAKEMGRTLTCEGCWGRGLRMQSVDRSYRVPCGTCSQTGQVQCRKCDVEGKVQCEQCAGKGNIKCDECDGKQFLYWWWAVERSIEQLKDVLEPWWDNTQSTEVPDKRIAAAGFLNDAGQAVVVWKEGSPSPTVLHEAASNAVPKELVRQRLGHLIESVPNPRSSGKPTGYELIVETLCCASAFYSWGTDEEFCVWACGGASSLGANASPLTRGFEQLLMKVRENWGADGSSLTEAEKQQCIRTARFGLDIAKNDAWLKETAAFSGLPPNLKSLADTEAWVIFGQATLKRSVGTVKDVASSIGNWLGGLWGGGKKGGTQ